MSENKRTAEQVKVDLITTFDKLLNKAKTDKGILKTLKQLHVEHKNYEIAALTREYELIHFPENKQAIQEQKFAEELVLLFNMVGVQIEPGIAWLLYQTSLKFNSNPEDFKLSDGTKLQADYKKFFKE